MSGIQMIGVAKLSPKRFYYTNKNRSGTAINEQIKPGYVMCFDSENTVPDYTAAQSKGVAVHKPETGNLPAFAGIVTRCDLLPTSNGVKNAGAGWIEVVSVADRIEAYTHANMTELATTLITANGDWGLIASTGIGSIGVIYQHVGIALETADTSSTLANKLITLKGPGCVSI